MNGERITYAISAVVWALGMIFVAWALAPDRRDTP